MTPLKAIISAALLCMATSLSAQTPAHDPSEKLRSVLPPDVAARVLTRIAAARAHELPAAALEHRALELAAKGVRAEDVETGVERHAARLERARDALRGGGHARPADAETEAAELAMGKGVDGVAVSALARSAPSGRSLAVPLMVLSSHLDRGLPSDQALARVHAAMQARAVARAQREHGGGRPATAGRPDTVPANPGAANRPTTPPGRGRS